MTDGNAGDPDLRMGEPRGRWVLFATVLGSSIALIDSTVVNVALPRLGDDLHATVAGLQWTVNGYTLTLAAFILLGGSLGDRYGRRRIFSIGAVWFAVASALCGLSPSIGALIGARLLQGVGGAMLTPGSLALIQASFRPDDRGRAVGAWSGFSGVAAAVGPLLGGWLVGFAGWRSVFWINVPVAAVVVLLARRHVPESRYSPGAGAPVPGRRHFDVAGALLAVVGLAGVTYALVSGPAGSPVSAVVFGAAGLAALAAFLLVERHSDDPMVPLGLFGARQFSTVNLVTLWVYAANGVLFFFVVLQLQVVGGYSPIAAGTALLPVTIALLLLSSRAGALGQRIGARLPMTLGTALCAAGAVLLAHVGTVSSYLVSVLPGAALYGIGLGLTVAPLTAAVLGAVSSQRAGVASGVNNAVARAAGLLSVAVVPSAVGLTGTAYRDPGLFDHGYRLALVVGAAFMAVAAVLSWVTVSGLPGGGMPESRVHCSVSSPPLEGSGPRSRS